MDGKDHSFFYLVFLAGQGGEIFGVVFPFGVGEDASRNGDEGVGRVPLRAIGEHAEGIHVVLSISVTLQIGIRPPAIIDVLHTQNILL